MNVLSYKSLGLLCLAFVLGACGSGSRNSRGSGDGDGDESLGDGDESSGDGDVGAGDGDESMEAPECLTTVECPDGGVCRDEVCIIPESCSSNEDCGVNSECHPERGVCVECLVGADCAATQTCLANVCRDACLSDAACDGTDRCSENGYCAECLDDDGCADDEHCSQSLCVADSCVARSTTCTPDGDVLVCSERGDGSVELDCPSDESCGTEQGPAWCQGWICTPNQTRCNEEENIAETCSENGLTIASSEDCNATDSLCHEGECRPYICDPYENYCQGGHVYTCDALGISGTVAEVCGEYEYCDPPLAVCRPQTCTPNEVACDGGQVATCNELGSGFQAHTPCETNEVCELGACAPIICDPYQRFCAGGNVRACNSSGTADILEETCASTEICDDSEGDAYCSTDVCTPLQTACEGDVLGTCNEHGSGLSGAATTDCTETGRVCYAGACEDVICNNFSRLCVGGNVHQCINRGSATALYDTCTAAEYCDEDTATCQPKICAPSEPGCDGAVARICNADGSGWLAGGTNCGALDLVCDTGSCEPIVCTPNSRYCSGTQVMLCNALGTSGLAESSCTAAYHCYQSSDTSAYCRVDQCIGGVSLCNGSVATTCASDGSGPLPTGTDCGMANQACWGGTCEDVVCAGTYECVGGDFHNCLNNGTATSLAADCTSAQYCNETLGCRAQVCSPNTATCLTPTTRRVCNPDGSGYTNVPCSAENGCWNGACSPLVCTSGQTLCQSGDFYLCGQNGTGMSLINDCLTSQYCDPTAGCLADVCVANQAMCAGSRVTTCNADGSAPLPGGTDCSAGGQACYDASCHPIVCSDGEFFCDEQELSQCVNNGTAIEVIDNCLAGSHCVEDAGVCLLDVCTPGATACLDFDTVMTCSTNGTGYDLPGIDCPAGEVCEGGACVTESSTCSIAGKTWSSPTLISSSYSSAPNVGTDLAGNVVAAWADAQGLRVARYSADADAWTTAIIDADGESYPAPSLAVSPDGYAAILYHVLDPQTFEYDVRGALYHPGTQTWTLSDALWSVDAGFDSNFSIRATLGGRFAALNCDLFEGIHATVYSPEFGWLAPTALDVGGSTYGQDCSLDLRASGKAVAAWAREGNTAIDGAKWATFDFASGAWSAPQVAARPVIGGMDGPVDVIAMDDALTGFQVAYVAVGEQSLWDLMVKSWTGENGLGPAVRLQADFYGTSLRFVHAPDDLYLFSSSITGVLASGSSTWTTEGGRDPAGGAFAYASGDTLTGGSYLTTYHYVNGSEWTTQSSSNRYGAIAPLDNCGAVWVYRNGTSGTYASWLE